MTEQNRDATDFEEAAVREKEIDPSGWTCQRRGNSEYMIKDANSLVIATAISNEMAEFIINSCLNYKTLVEACRAEKTLADILSQVADC